MKKNFRLASIGLVALIFALSAIGASADEPVKLTGAGASFPAPLYNKWFKEYHAKNNVQIDYQSVGSGSGIKNFINKTVDFGASDAAMAPEEIAQVDVGTQLLPMTAGAIVLTYNLEGVPELSLSRDAYTGIFLGKITKWNDPAIVKTKGAIAADELVLLKYHRRSPPVLPYDLVIIQISEAFHLYPACARPVQAIETSEQGRFSGARLPEEHRYLAGMNGQCGLLQTDHPIGVLY